MTTLDTEMVLRKLGLWQAAEAEGVDEILTFDHMKRSHVKPEGAFSWPEGFYVPEFLASVDYVIALPVIKTHWTATFTMGLKSQISITADRDRRQLPHGQHKYVLFGNMIAESNLVYKPDFYISDATKCLVTGGPDMGTLKEPGIVMACSDVIANDVVGACSAENPWDCSENSGTLGMGSAPDQKSSRTWTGDTQQRRNNNKKLRN